MGAIGTVGGVLSAIGAATSAIRTVQGAIGAVNGIDGRDAAAQKKQDALALRQLQERQRQQEQQTAAQNALDKERLAAAAAQDEDARRQALKRAVARQRAQFGAQGVGETGGSADAVLLGLFQESDAERAQREKMDALRAGALDLGADQARSVNVLQATQLAERQKLERVG